MSLLQNRSNYQHHAQAAGGSGTEKNACKCPAGHSLQFLKASAGSCDGCKARVVDGEYVRACIDCNWYLCQQCHRGRREPQSWLWGSVSSMAEKLALEFSDLKEVAEIAETKGPLAACAAHPVGRGGPGDDTEITVSQEEESGACQAVVAAPVTPAGTAPHAADAAQVEQPTPPKVDAPKEPPMVDLLDLDFEPKVATSSHVDAVHTVLPLDLL